MSIIAAGTTTTTALSSTGNTDGTLQFQVNGTTPSVTLNTLGAVGVGSTPNFGTAGQALVSAGSTAAPTWANVTTSPAGSNTQIQYNNSGSFGASSNLTWNGSALAVTGAINATGGISGTAGANISGAGWGVLPYVANSLVLDNNSGESRFFATGANSTTDGSFLFYTGQTDGGANERFRIGTAGQFGIAGANYGSSGQVLTSGGASAAPSWTTVGGSAMVRLDTQTVSAVSAVNFDNISTTYTNYLLIFEGVYNSSAASVALRMRYRYSGTTDTGTAYSSVFNQSTGAAISGGSAAMDSNIAFNSNSPTVTGPASAIFGVTNISTHLNNSGGSYIIRSQSFLQNPNNGGGSPFGGFPYTNWVSGGYQGSSSGNSTITGINLYVTSGGITGKFTLYGLT
jgi:hypothetical protein